MPMFWFSGDIAKRLSVIGVLILSLFAYIIRFLIYASLSTSPWWGLPAEVLRGCTFGAMWAAATSHAHRIAPPGLTATMVSARGVVAAIRPLYARAQS